MNLFEHADQYPLAAGWKDNTTSRDAAIAIEKSGKAENDRKLVLGWYTRNIDGTADECAHGLDMSITSIRPRVSQLYAMGLLERTGERRTTDGGMKAHVMRAVK